VSGAVSLAYVVLDVFTSRAYAGNPLAVVMDADELSGAQMLTITRQFNLSETAFPLTPSQEERESGADYVLRIFTPGSEVPFAGHPSVGFRPARCTSSAARACCPLTSPPPGRR
jgi:trans-2,3-dihydro-3-hydroxyanthranilate isomerase